MTTRIDCDTCVVRGLACHDCVVTVLLGPPPELSFDDDERRALDVLAERRPGATAADGPAPLDGTDDRVRVTRARVQARAWDRRDACDWCDCCGRTEPT